MVMKPHQKLWVGAVGTLLVGGIAAASIFQTPPSSGPTNARTLRELAERVSSAPLPSVNPVVPPAVPEPAAAPKPVARIRRSTPPPPPVAKPVETAEARAALARAASEELVKNIALMGITHQGNDLQVWLVDLSNNERTVVGEGEDAFGFTVRDIADEHVLLARGPDEFSIWLGEKQIPVANAEEGSSGTGFAPGGLGPGGMGNGWGGGDRRAMMMGALAAMAGGGRSGGWRGGGGGWSGGRGGWGGGSWSGGNFNRSRSGGWGNSSFRPTFNAGGFRPGGFGGGFAGGGNRGGNQGNRDSGVQLSTSNPQTARRRGSRLVGGSEPLPTPSAVSNPQTLRRRGTSSGQAFGDNSSSSRGGTSRTGSNRTSGR